MSLQKLAGQPETPAVVVELHLALLASKILSVAGLVQLKLTGAVVRNSVVLIARVPAGL